VNRTLKPESPVFGNKKSYLALEFAVSAVSYNAALAFAAIPNVLMKDVNIGAEGFAFYSGIFILALMIFSFPAGVLASRLGSVRVVFIGQIIIGLSSFVFGFTSSYTVQIISRAALGLGSSFWWVASPENIVSAFGRNNSAIPITLWLSGYATGAAASYPLTALGTNLLGWHSVFELYGGVSLLVASFYLLRLRQRIMSPETSSPIRGSVQRVLKHSTEWGSPSFGSKRYTTNGYTAILSHLKKRWVLSVGSAMLLQFFAWFGILTFFPFYLTQNGFDLISSGAFSFLLVVFGVPAFLLGGVMAAKLKRTAPILLLGLALLSTVALIPYAVSKYADTPILLYVVLAAIGIGLALPDIAWTFLSEVLTMPGGGSISFGFVNSFGLVGAILGTTMTPFLSAVFGWPVVWLVYALSVAGSFIVSLSIRKEENKWFTRTQAA
jgi:sugar phosphate permease